MTSIPFEGPEGRELPICQKCHEKPAMVTCSKCGLFLCVDCRKNHVCDKKGGNGRKK